ncbi:MULTISPECIES: hypothetical protein [Acinetobacter]|uniref:hypothetical protein n=1 Tax=Acinetobacter TaxID=469 RepID=UPI001F4A989D|nr:MULTISPECIES: hypothetical protein [Acinetobacter]MCH7379968.1 hypothetical protein [Acinetobacter higginsii]
MAKRLRDVRSRDRKVFWYESLDFFLSHNYFETGMHCFQCGGLFYDVLIENNNAETTNYFFSNTVYNKDIILPYYSDVFKSKIANQVFFSDPNLLIDDKLDVAWFAGKYRDINLQDILLKTIRHIDKSLKSKKQIFFGKNSGGFAALFFSWFFKNSLAFVVNPQTKISGLNQEDSIKNFAKYCFSDSNLNMSKKLELICPDLTKLYALIMDNNVVCLQNQFSNYMDLHLTPFLEKIKCPEKAKVIYGNCDEGNIDLAFNYIQQFLICFEHSDDWTDAIQADFIN